MKPAADDRATSAARIELVCPAGNLPALRAAVDSGADAVYIGLRDDTNARNFGGLNFDLAALREGIGYAHRRRVKVLMAINTYPHPAAWQRWTAAVDTAAGLGIDAVIIADAGLMQYAAGAHPGLRLHLSVQASATNYEAINFYHSRFNIRRAVLPRVLSIAQVGHLARNTPVEVEVFGFGSLCVMVEGRCALSSYVTGEAPNLAGVCSPARAVRWQQRDDGLEARLNGVLVDRFDATEQAGYPTLCKGRYAAGSTPYYAIEEPASLNTLDLLPELARAGVAAVKIEGRQRSAAYVAAVTRVWRQGLDALARSPREYAVAPPWTQALKTLSEGRQCTLGAYHRSWQ